MLIPFGKHNNLLYVTKFSGHVLFYILGSSDEPEALPIFPGGVYFHIILGICADIFLWR